MKIVYDTVGTAETLEVGVRITDPCARIVITGVGAPKRFEWTPLYFKEVELVGSNAFGVEEVEGVRATPWSTTCGSFLKARSTRCGLSRTVSPRSISRGLPYVACEGPPRRGEGRLRLRSRHCLRGRLRDDARSVSGPETQLRCRLKCSTRSLTADPVTLTRRICRGSNSGDRGEGQGPPPTSTTAGSHRRRAERCP